MRELAPGVYTRTLGTPEEHTPLRYKEIPPALEAMRALPAGPLPWDEDAVTGRRTARGYVVELPLDETEQIFGFGLQLKSFNQTLLKKTLRTNSDPVADTGDSHAPVPFFVSTRGYGVLINTLRYAAVYTGAHTQLGCGRTPTEAWRVTQPWNRGDLHRDRAGPERRIEIDVPVAPGVELLVFTGPALKDAVRRYVLFSGGGVLPPLWSLGVWYRVYGQFTQEQTLALARDLRAARMPCDVLGLEPGWHAHSYACTYTWSDKFPDPAGLLAETRLLGYKLNLWEHAFVHQGSPLYAGLRAHGGSHEVWDGLVPDFTIPAARQAFGNYQEQAFVARGVAGFKLDECDNSDFVAYAWSFPEHARFPSGLDGEQYHNLFGLAYQRTLGDVFRRRNQRTLGQVRASGAFAAPYPFVLYSDLYEHADFIRGVVNQGFTGLLWSPEVREGVTSEGLIRRIESVVLSPQALINAWYIPLPPWLQVDRARNEAGERMPEADAVEEAVRKLFELRMALLPYLYAAFAKYALEGEPPFRALAMDWPEDPQTHQLDDAYMIGESLLAAPVLVGRDGHGLEERQVYLPAHPGGWYDVHTHQHWAGGATHRIAAPLGRPPLFVKANRILPLAEPTLFVAEHVCFNLIAHLYGSAPEACILFEDDDGTFGYQQGAYNIVRLEPTQRVSRQGALQHERYTVKNWLAHN